MQNISSNRPISRTGIGLRSCHYQHILTYQPDIPWFEALTDNYLNDPVALDYLIEIRKHYPVTLHGVGLSLGSTDPLDRDYLKKLKNLINIIEPAFVSDHLSWSSINNIYFHDLLPLPFTQEAITHVSERINQVQDFLGKKISVENASSYIAYKDSEMREWDFINSIVNHTGCGVLLDVNNVYVTAANQDFSPKDFLLKINASAVQQYHLAGYSDEGTYLFDTHSESIHPPVWQLYQNALETVGVLPTLIERDDNIPPFTVLQAEAKKADELMIQVAAVHV